VLPASFRALARILPYEARMPAHSRRWGWRISAALFGAILIALVIAALLLDPLTASVP